MTQEKTVQQKNNNKIIALTIITIILAASLVGVLVIYQPSLQSQLAEKENTITMLQAQNEDLQANLSQSISPSTYATQIAQLNSQIQYLNDTLTYVYADYANLQSIVQLSKTGVLYNAASSQNTNTATTIWNDQLDYAGYILIQATASSNTTYAQVLYSYGESDFDYKQTLGTSGTAIFPVLPSIVEVRIGNTMTTDANNITVTATYYY